MGAGDEPSFCSVNSAVPPQGRDNIVANRNFPFSVLDAATRFPITLIYASPVHYYLLGASDLVAPNALANVRLAVSTAMKMPRDISKRFAEKFSIVPAEAYGIIEVGLPFINTDPHTSEENSVGRILPDYLLQIANPDADGIGEVLLKGKGMFDAYVSPWRLREECLDNGWFHTGDLGQLDAEGRLSLLGRSKTVIVCAGMKVFPEEVEETINAMSGVAVSHWFLAANIRSLGTRRWRRSSFPAKLTIPTDSSSRSASLLGAAFVLQSPREFEIVPAIPKTSSGKLLRRGMGVPPM